MLAACSATTLRTYVEDTAGLNDIELRAIFVQCTQNSSDAKRPNRRVESVCLDIQAQAFDDILPSLVRMSMSRRGKVEHALSGGGALNVWRWLDASSRALLEI
jgi:hypothetical protein